jgi:hypothetical protein
MFRDRKRLLRGAQTTLSISLNAIRRHVLEKLHELAIESTVTSPPEGCETLTAHVYGHGEAPRAPRDEGPHSLGAVDLEEQARAAALTPALTASIARPQALSGALATGRASS